MLKQMDEPLTKNEFQRLVLETCKAVGQLHWCKVINANRGYLLKYLSPNQ